MVEQIRRFQPEVIVTYSQAGAQLARYKLPTRLQVVDELPRNPAGKILKFELRDRFDG